MILRTPTIDLSALRLIEFAGNENNVRHHRERTLPLLPR